MATGDPFADPKGEIAAGIRQLREALTLLRENVVTAVKRRNTLQDEVARWDRDLADLEAKAALAEKLNDARLAAEIRAEAKRREPERDRLRAALTTAEAEAEAAKIRMPEEEARLLQQANDLRAQLARATGARVEANLPGGLGTEADAMWNRATEKVRDLEREAAARNEVAGIQSGNPSTGSTYTPRTSPPSYDQSAEQMLAALEARMGTAPPEAAAVADAPVPSARYLELDDRQPTQEPEKQPTQNPDREPKAAEKGAGAGVETAGAVKDTAPSSAVALPAELIETGVAEKVSSAKNTPFIRKVSVKGEILRMEPTQRVRVAAIGTGNIFRGAHLPAYPDLPQIQLVAFCDPDKTAQELTYKRYLSLMEAKIKAARERDDAPAAERFEQDLETVQICDDISEVIETIKPDLVDICTQPFLHTPLAIQALEAGLNVMCEKPISRSWLESQRLIETIKRTGKFYQHNENWLFEPDYYTVKKLVDAGAIGELIAMFLTQAHGGPEGNPKFWNSDFGGGGALLDNGIHAIGAAWFVAGLEKSPTYVKAAEPFGMSIRMPHRIIEGRYQQITVDDDAHILIRFEDSTTHTWSTAHVEGSWSEQDSPDTVYIGSTGRIQMQNEDGKRFAVVTDAHGNVSRKIRVSGSNWQHWPSSFYGEIQNMAECVRNNRQSIMTAEYGADCSAIVGASYLSEKQGKKPVHVEEFKAFARDIAARYPDDPTGADNALVDALLAAVRAK